MKQKLDLSFMLLAILCRFLHRREAIGFFTHLKDSKNPIPSSVKYPQLKLPNKTAN
jgi:hypothetical protein